MNNDQLNNEMDDLFRKGLENLSEERPAGQEWEKMKGRMEKEGLLTSKTKWRRFIIPLSFILIGSVAGSLYISDKKDSLKTTESERMTANQTEKVSTSNAIPSPSTGSAAASERATAKMDSESKINYGIKELVFTKQEKNLAAETNDRKMQATSFKKRASENSVSNGQAAKLKRSHSTLKKEKASLNQETASSKDFSARKDSGDDKAPGKIQGSDQPANVNQQADSSQGNKNDNGTPSSGATADNHPAPDTTSANTPKEVPVSDSLKMTNDAVPTVAKQKAPERSKFHIGGFFSFDFNNYLLKKNNTVPVSDVDDVYNSASVNGINSTSQYTVGITLGYMVNSHFEIEGGASYSKKKEVKDNVTTPPSRIDSTDQGYSDFIYDYNATYLEFSGKIKYYYPVGKGKWLYAGAGGIGSFNFPENKNDLGYYTHISYIDTTWVRSDKVTLQPSSAIFSAVFLAGFETELNDKWNVFIEPEYKYGLDPVINQPVFNYIPVNHYWRTFSIGFGLKHGF